MAFFEKCLFSFYAHFLIGSFSFLFVVVLLLKCVSSLYILAINPLTDRWLEKIFSHSIDCLFILLMISLAVKKLVSLMWSHLFIFACWSVKSKDNHYQDQCQGAYPLFSSRSFTASSLNFKSLIHLSWFLCTVWDGIQFHFFAWGCPVFPTLLIEETILSPLCSLDSCVKN